jgi:glyoxylate carboligase
MLSTRVLRRAKKLAMVVTVAASGTLLGWGCTLEDIQHNIVAGTLGYIQASTTSFWSNLIAADDFWAALFNRQ